MANVKGTINEQIFATRLPEDGKVYQEDLIVLEYDFDSTVISINIPASVAHPVYLIEVLHLVRTALAGGTATITIGDGTTANLYGTSAQVVPATVNTLWRSVIGKKLTANATILLTIGASNTAGAGTLMARVFRLE